MNSIEEESFNGVRDLAHVEYQASGKDRRETEGCGGENEVIR
jgi:hypothetical protein